MQQILEHSVGHKMLLRIKYEIIEKMKLIQTTRFQDEESQTRMTGTDAIKAHIIAAKAVANTLKTSLGPKGE